MERYGFDQGLHKLELECKSDRLNRHKHQTNPENDINIVLKFY